MTAKNKPHISVEARQRIKAFVVAVEKLQKTYGIEIAVQDDTIGLRDMRRKDNWCGYGEFDAQIFNAEMLRRFRLKNIEFEAFRLWGA